MPQKIYSRWAHLQARNLIFALRAPVGVQLRLRPLNIVKWVPGSDHPDSWYEVDKENHRELMLLLYRLAPVDKVEYISWLYVHFLLETLPLETQLELTQIVKGYYATSTN